MAISSSRKSTSEKVFNVDTGRDTTGVGLRYTGPALFGRGRKVPVREDMGMFSYGELLLPSFTLSTALRMRRSPLADNPAATQVAQHSPRRALTPATKSADSEAFRADFVRSFSVSVGTRTAFGGGPLDGPACCVAGGLVVIGIVVVEAVFLSRFALAFRHSSTISCKSSTQLGAVGTRGVMVDLGAAIVVLLAVVEGVPRIHSAGTSQLILSSAVSVP